MEEFFEPYNWSEIETQTSAFHRYTGALPSLPHRYASIPNVHNRMLQFLRMNQAALMAAPPLQTEPIEQQKERSLKHKMVERMRRQTHRQSYLALHQLLPLGTKSDKQSTVEMAGKEMQELQRCRDELRKRIEEMEMEMMVAEKAELNLKVEFPASALDSLLEVLHCLRQNGCSATSIQSNFLHHHFAAAIHFETRMRAAAEVEKAVQRCLFEAEMKFRHQN